MSSQDNSTSAKELVLMLANSTNVKTNWPSKNELVPYGRKIREKRKSMKKICEYWELFKSFLKRDAKVLELEVPGFHSNLMWKRNGHSKYSRRNTEIQISQLSKKRPQVQLILPILWSNLLPEAMNCEAIPSQGGEIKGVFGDFDDTWAKKYGILCQD
jgi:hypothetical protein